jgi:hypothetical protein
MRDGDDGGVEGRGGWNRLWSVMAGALVLGGSVLGAEDLNESMPAFDFREPGQVAAWEATHDIVRVDPSDEGMVVWIGGGDPYLTGPRRDYPVGRLLWLRLRLKSDVGGMGQVFYFDDAPAEERSARFIVPSGGWHHVRVPLPALGTGYRLRIDPPGNEGRCVLGAVWFEERVVWASPEWPVPPVPEFGGEALVVRAGELELRHNEEGLGGFEVRVANRAMGIGNVAARIGYVKGKELRWTAMGGDVGQEGGAENGREFRVRQEGEGIEVTSLWMDADGGRWRVRQSFEPLGSGSIAVESEIAVDRDREVVYLPVLTLLPGAGGFGTNKSQGLLAGVEYLENEPSSSEADLEGPASRRLVPDFVKVTFPLMVVQAEGRYVALGWAAQPQLSAVYDSPDRQFRSGGHLMGLLYPGSDGVNREEGSLLPYWSERLVAEEPLRVKATLMGGVGKSVVPAIQEHVRLVGLPGVPAHGYTAERYYELAARGWLRSRVREGDLYRHAVWPGFDAQPAADAAVWMLWLSGQGGVSGMTAELMAASEGARHEVVAARYNGAQIGHVRYPLPALAFGSVEENVDQARAQGEVLLRRFEEDGSVRYRPNRGGVDYGRTHWAQEASGLTASVVVQMLEASIFSGDKLHRERGIGYLRALKKFEQTVPRGAQTWEIPLHTPDILASAHLVRAYTLGYELTGDESFLEQARYWAWTGVPFVYLSSPGPGAVGVYGTIAVLGATGWRAPVWIGQPVQWCGLVYADALYRFAKHDPQGPWRRLADGITAAGLQHSWPTDDTQRQGLLPDFFLIRSQRRDGPAINPATLQVAAIRFFEGAVPYDYHVFRRHGMIVHAAGAIEEVSEGEEGVGLSVRPWMARPSWVLVNGVSRVPVVRMDGEEAVLEDEYEEKAERLLLQVKGPVRIELGY